MSQFDKYRPLAMQKRGRGDASDYGSDTEITPSPASRNESLHIRYIMMMRGV